MGYIYKITNDINDKIYIGKTEFDIQKRFYEHCKDSKRGYTNRPLYNAMNKFGIEHFSIEEIEQYKENLEQREQYWIQYYDSFYNGYNATLGGDGKAYIDYNYIIELFIQGLNITEIAQKTNHDSGHISKILKEKGNISQKQIDKQAMKTQEKIVCMLDKNTKEIIKIFQSVAEASQYCIDNKLSTDTIKGISAHISQCCNKIRKSAYEYCWKYLEN